MKKPIVDITESSTFIAPIIIVKIAIEIAPTPFGVRRIVLNQILEKISGRYLALELI
jgi:hypothetical protein